MEISLQEGSPAINNGANVGLTSDYEGNPIVGTPDIGAYDLMRVLILVLKIKHFILIPLCWN